MTTPADWMTDITNLGMTYIEKNAPAQQSAAPAPAVLPATSGISTTTILLGVGAILAIVLVVKVGKLI